MQTKRLVGRLITALQGYGFATLPDVKATADTLWYGASTSKAQTAAVLSHLIHSDKYSALAKGWSTTISSLIRDDFVLPDEWATGHITLDDAVSHRTGVVGHDLATVASNASNAATAVRDTVRNLRNLPGNSEPRTVYMYCNNMFVTLSHVLETLTGEWLGDLLRKHLWAPLGMDATFFNLQDAKDAKNHLADGYFWDQEAEEYKQVDHLHVAAASGAGAVLSSAVDYAKWVRCLLYEGAPLSKAVHKDIKTPRMITAGPNTGLDIQLYALGWNRGTYNGHVVYTHSGGMHAFGAEVFWVPEAKFGAVAFGNTAVSANAVEEVLIYKLLGEKLGIPEEKRFDIGGL